MFKSISQSLVAAAFIGTGIVSGTDSTASWTITEASLPAILAGAHMQGLTGSIDATDPVVTARRYRAD